MSSNILSSTTLSLNHLRTTLLALGTAAVLFGFNHAVYTKEQLLSAGAVVKLKLAPRDPRSLMTGDYMALNFDLANQLNRVQRDAPNVKKIAQDGFVVVKLNDQGVGSYVSHSTELPTVILPQMALQFRQRSGDIKFATNAFFFQEGQAKAFEAAQYGEFRVSAKGELLLTHLLDAKLTRIQP